MVSVENRRHLVLEARNAIDLDLSSAAQNGLCCCSYWRVCGKELLVNLVHSVKIIEVGEMDADLHNAGQIASGSFENRAEIGEFEARF